MIIDLIWKVSSGFTVRAGPEKQMMIAVAWSMGPISLRRRFSILLKGMLVFRFT
jgi:hypothetical protein